MDEKEELELIKFARENGITVEKMRELMEGYAKAIAQMKEMQEIIAEMQEKKNTKEILKMQSDDLKEIVSIGKSIEELKKVYPQEDTFKLVMAYKMMREDTRKDDAQIQALLQKIDSLEKALLEQKYKSEQERIRGELLAKISALETRISSTPTVSQIRSGQPLQEIKDIIESYKSLKEGLKELGLASEGGGIKDKLIEGAIAQLGSSLINLLQKVGINPSDMLASQQPSTPPPAPEDIYNQDKFDEDAKKWIEQYGNAIAEGDIRITDGNCIVGKSPIAQEWYNITPFPDNTLKPYISPDNYFVIPPEHKESFLLFLRDRVKGVNNGKTPI